MSRAAVRIRTPFRKGGTKFDRYQQAQNAWACKNPDCFWLYNTRPFETRRPRPHACDECHGTEFWELASSIEAQRFGTLVIMQGQGLITNLEAQRTFDLVVNDKKVTTWRCDFIYRVVATQQWEVEDVKAHGSPIDPVSKLKHALFDACYRQHGMHVTRVYL